MAGSSLVLKVLPNVFSAKRAGYYEGALAKEGLMEHTPTTRGGTT